MWNHSSLQRPVLLDGGCKKVMICNMEYIPMEIEVVSEHSGVKRAVISHCLPPQSRHMHDDNSDSRCFYSVSLFLQCFYSVSLLLQCFYSVSTVFLQCYIVSTVLGCFYSVSTVFLQCYIVSTVLGCFYSVSTVFLQCFYSVTLFLQC